MKCWIHQWTVRGRGHEVNNAKNVAIAIMISLLTSATPQSYATVAEYNPGYRDEYSVG
jgi:hypothetical protein